MRLISSKDLRCGDVVVCGDSRVSVCTTKNYQSLVMNKIGLSMIPVLTLGETNTMIASNEDIFDEYINYWFTLSRSRLPREVVDSVRHEVCNSMYIIREELYPLLLLKNIHPNTFRHCVDVMIYAVCLNEVLCVGDVTKLSVGGIFHDVGKLKIPNEILRKPSELTEAEFKEIKQHPIYGYEIMEGKLDIDILRIIRYHHLYRDYTGYPEEPYKVPEIIQLVTVCDIFDAVVSKRSYHRAKPTSTGINVLRRDAEKGKLNKDFVLCLERMLNM